MGDSNKGSPLTLRDLVALLSLLVTTFAAGVMVGLAF